jgi:hypothetical protein
MNLTGGIQYTRITASSAQQDLHLMFNLLPTVTCLTKTVSCIPMRQRAKGETYLKSRRVGLELGVDGRNGIEGKLRVRVTGGILQ